jgi:transposase
MEGNDLETPRKEYSPHKRTRVALAYLSGSTRKMVAQNEGVKEGSVPGIVTRYLLQQSGKSSPRSGRPTKINARDLRRVLRIISINPFISPKDLINQAGLGVSVPTLRTALKKEGIHHYKALRRPKLNELLARKRLAFARRYINEPAAFWHNWVFSDETTVARGDGEPQLWVWCRKVYPPPLLQSAITHQRREND